MKKIIKMFIAILAVVCVFGLVSCKETVKKDDAKPYNALGDFVVGDETNVYSIATNTSEILDIDYTKLDDETHRNSYIKKTIASTIKLEEYKKLVITVEGMGDVKVELVAGDTTLAVSLNVIETAGTYEWNLIPHVSTLKKVTEIRVYGAAGRTVTTGQVAFTSLTFDTAAAEGYIIQTGFNNIPSNVNEYNGTDENFDFNAKWDNINDSTVYTIEQDSDTKVVEVKYEKGAEDAWACMLSQVRGKLAKFNYIVVVAQGTEGKELMIKAEGLAAKETKETFDGTKQTFVLDISTFSNEQKNGISKVVLFGSPNLIQNGRFTIYEAYMSETSPIEVEKIHKNVYDGTSAEFDISEYWYDGSDKVYTVEKVANGLKVTFGKKGEYATLKAYVEGKLSNFKYLAAEVSSESETSIMLKAADRCETQAIKLSSEIKVVYVDISKVENLDQLSEVIIFGNPGSTNGGEFVIHKAYFANEIKGIEMPTTNVYDRHYDSFDVNHYWADNGTGTYTVKEEGTTTVVEYTKNPNCEWATVKTTMEKVTDEFKYIKLVIKGTGKQILVKPNDNGAYEKWIDLTGEEQTVYVRIPANMSIIHIFCEPGSANKETGTLEIKEALLVRDVVVDEKETSVDVAGDFFTGEPNIYQVSKVEKGITIAYDKPAGNWSTLKAFIAGYNEGFKTLTLTFKGVAGTQILVKPNDAYDIFYDVTGEEQTVVIKDLPTPLKSIVLFVAPNTSEAVTGTFELTSAVLSKEDAPIELTKLIGAYSDCSDNNYYDITEENDKVVIKYNVAQAGYFFFVLTLDEPMKNVETLYMTFSADAQLKVLVKPNDSNAFEQEVEVGTSEVVFKKDINDTLTKIIFFINPNIAGTTGTLTITNAGTTIKEGPITNEYTNGDTFDINKNWYDGGDKVYEVSTAGTETVFNFTKGNLEWPSAKTLISGVTNQFNYIVLTANGTEGLSILVKSVGDEAVERTIELSETDRTFYIELAENVREILIFAAPGTANVTGTLTIKAMTLMKLETAEGNIATKLTSSNGKFAVSSEADTTIISYKNKDNWDSAFVSLLPMSMEGKAIQLSFKSTTVTKMIVKLNNINSYETHLNFVDSMAEATVTILPEKLTEVRIFIDFESGITSGSLEASIKVVEGTPVEELTWTAVDGGDGVFAITTANLFDVEFNKTNQQYAYMKVLPSKVVKGTKVTLVMSSAEGSSVTVKPNDRFETTVTLTTTPSEYVIEMNEEVSLTFIIVMAEISVETKAGTFTIHSIKVE